MKQHLHSPRRPKAKDHPQRHIPEWMARFTATAAGRLFGWFIESIFTDAG